MKLEDRSDTRKAVYYTHRGGGRECKEGPTFLARAAVDNEVAEVWTAGSGAEDWFYRPSTCDTYPIVIGHYSRNGSGFQTDEWLLFDYAYKTPPTEDEWQQYLQQWLRHILKRD